MHPRERAMRAIAADRSPSWSPGTRTRRAGSRCSAAALVLLACFACRNEVERAPGEARPFVEEVLPAPRERVAAAVERAFNHVTMTGVPEHKFPSSDWLDRCRLFPLGNEVRPWMGGPDPAMRRYVSVPEERRSADLILSCRVGSPWPSEYRSLRGAPVPFITDFIIHLDAISPEATRVEIIEYFPQVIAGTKFGFGYHALLPSFIEDVQSVAPTTTDRLHVLDQIRRALSKP